MIQNFAALDIGGTKIAGALAQLSALNEIPVLTTPITIATEAQKGGAEVAHRVVQLVQDLVSQAKTRGERLDGVAISSAGLVDTRKAAIISATDLMPGWGGIPLGDLITEATGLPVAVLNDVHAHALGELKWGIGQGLDSALVFAVGTGIGGAIIHDGKVIFGQHGLAGHLGHIKHPLAGDLRCSCGRTGHLESVASGSGMIQLFNDSAATVVQHGREIVALADNGDPAAIAAITDAAFALGEVIAGLVNSFDPQAVIISGSVVNAGLRWQRAVTLGFKNQAMNIVQDTPILFGSLAGTAPLLGAVAYAVAHLTEKI